MLISQPVICETVARQLHELIADSWAQIIADQQILWLLKEKLNEATIVDDSQLTPAIVTLDSQVTLKFVESLHVETFQLVHPKDANILSARLSVLTPIGVGVLGQQKAETVSIRATTGSRYVSIADVARHNSENGLINNPVFCTND